MSRKSLTLLGVLSVSAALASTAAIAEPTNIGPPPAAKTITTTIVFNVRNQDQLKNYIRETVTPGSAHYRDFLTVDEFRALYAPSDEEIDRVKQYLAQHRIRTDRVFGNNLAMTITGSVGAINHLLSTQIENFQEANPKPNQRAHFHRPKHQPRIPQFLRENGVMAVVGLSNEYKARSMRKSVPLPNDVANVPSLKAASVKGNTLVTDQPGMYTVGDVAVMYNINPLYEENITGAGTTIGIATYADFHPEDAYTYWNMIELPDKPDRIVQVHVDGGGVMGAKAGSGETSLDVEQSGGLAPNANIVVYDAPNSSNGGIDMFYQIVSENRVDSLSYSWGLPEIFYSAALNGGVDETGTMRAENQAFMEAAAQGISVFASSGDAGSYDTNRSLPAPHYSTPLTVDWPAVSPYITAAGGTTTPVYFTNSAGKVVISVPHERAWGWDYLAAYYQACCNLTAIEAGVFSVGDGGGVSVYWPRPWYQDDVDGMAVSEADQSLDQLYNNSFKKPYPDARPPRTFLTLDAGFAGRNVPDISMDADPETGFLMYSSEDGGLLMGYGGTSFVAPQLNGVTALINQRVGGRVGLLNAQLYRLLGEYGYGAGSPFNDITHGDNWYWQGQTGYDPATGIGTPNVAALAEAMAGHTD